MNDVREWMSLDCLQQFNNLIQEADELDKGKAKGSAAKPAWAVGKGPGSGPGPKQVAHLLKKQRFNKIVSDLAANKAFFMSFVRHPIVA